MKVLWTLAARVVLLVNALVGVYFLIASPPLHLLYESMPAAGRSSVYVPGSGFSGFWYHLGILNNMHDLHDYDYYCYSSGCLSLVLSFLNTTVDDTADVCLSLQDSWIEGRLSSYDLVHHFLEQLLPEDDDDDFESSSSSSSSIEHFLPRVKVLVTTASDGVQVRQASDRQELVDLLIKTTWIPFVTGHGVVRDSTFANSSSLNADSLKDDDEDDDDDEIYLDGGFSRRLHPPCEYNIHVPTTWSTFIHTLNPGFGRNLLQEFWNMGRSSGHPFMDGVDDNAAYQYQPSEQVGLKLMDMDPHDTGRLPAGSSQS